MNIFLINTHSILNSGDVAIVLSQIQLFKKLFSSLRITLTSRTPEIDETLYGKMGIEVFSPIFPAPSVFDGRIGKITRSFKNLVNIEAKNNLLKKIKESDLVISSGGGYFYTNRKRFPGPMFFQNYLHIKIASALNKPIILFPQSFGPVSNSLASKMLKNMLESNKIVKIFAREEISYHFLKGLLDKEKNGGKIDLCPDMAFYLSKEVCPKGPHDIALNLPRPIIAMTLRQWDFPETKSNQDRRKKQEQYLATLQEICQNIFHVWGGSIVVFPQVRGPGIFENDRIISEKLYRNLEAVIPKQHLLFIDLPDIVSPLYIMNILSQVDLVLATRFHSAIFAFITGIPAISIGYQPKSRGIMSMLGLERFSVDISELNSEGILKLVQELLSHSSEIHREIGERIQHIRKVIETKLDHTFRPFY